MLESISSDADVITRTLPEADMWRARSWIACGFILVLSAGCVPGGTPICGAFGDACMKAADVARYLARESGELGAVSGGPFDHAGPGVKSGRLGLAVRAATARTATPRLDGHTIRPWEFDTTSVPVEERRAKTVSVDGTVRAWPGWRVGRTRAGSVDLGGGVMAIARNGVALDTEERLGFDVGARIGLLQETSVVPAVSLSVSRIYLPALSSSGFRLTAQDGTGILASVTDIDPEVTVTRFSVAKHLGRFGLAAGTSRAKYNSSASVDVRSSDGAVNETLSVTSRGSRRSLFLDGSLALGDRVTVEAELGRLSGGDGPEVVTRFSGRPIGDARQYVTVGLRFAVGKLYALP
jgi:hypothetical protein